MSRYICSHHDTHQNGCTTCEAAKDCYDKDDRIEQLTKELDEIRRGVESMRGKDGISIHSCSAVDEFLEQHKGEMI
jgi:hypothetical protein